MKALSAVSLTPALLAQRRTLIVGEVKTGKSALLARLLRDHLAQGTPGLAVMDLAPEATRGVGGKMPLPSPAPSLRVYSPEIAPPRLRGGAPEEVMALARTNGQAIDRVWEQYLRSPSRVLFINDVSMYLHAWPTERLLERLAATPTVIMNGYRGQSLGSDPFSQTERRRMERLAAACDYLVELG
ncbi:hypothetical protein AAU61_11940 [Desulfocarbo indianensis]|nr:hypothetical protein AAU61_11940 [Desulfocarbo indianensis]